MTTTEVEDRIKLIQKLNKRERLEALNELAEDIGNSFTENMSILESEIESALDNTGEKIKEELGYYDVSDVTQDVMIRASWEY